MVKPKTKISYPVRNERDRARVVSILTKMPINKDNPRMVTISMEVEQRRNKQNRLSFMWYKERGEMAGHGPVYERRHCKLTHGIPIMREHEDFNEQWEQTIGCLLYEQQLMAMDYMDVTSLMSVKEFARYLTEIDNEAGDMGMVLTHPDDLYWDALMKEGR